MILHLLSVDADFQTKRTQDLIKRQAGAEFEINVRTVGRGGSWRNILMAIAGLRRQKPRTVHAFGHEAFLAAAGSGAPNILFSAPPMFGLKSIAWMRSILAHCNVHLVFGSFQQQRLALKHGVDPQRCHLIRPGVEFGRLNRQRDAQLRTSLGFTAEDYVLLAPAGEARAAGHDLAVWTFSILHVLDPSYKLILWGTGDRLGCAGRLAEHLNQKSNVKIVDCSCKNSPSLEQLLCASDAGLITATAAVPTLPIAVCMAGSLPMVSTTNRFTAELLEDRHTALMTTEPAARSLAQRLLDLRSDPKLAWSIGDRARAEAYDFFPASRLLGEYRQLYRELKAVEIQNPTAAAIASAR